MSDSEFKELSQKKKHHYFKLLESRNIVQYMFSDHLYIMYIAHISTVCTQQPLSTPLLKAQRHKRLNCTSPSLKYFSVYHNLHLLFFFDTLFQSQSQSPQNVGAILLFCLKW